MCSIHDKLLGSTGRSSLVKESLFFSGIETEILFSFGGFSCLAFVYLFEMNIINTNICCVICVYCFTEGSQPSSQQERTTPPSVKQPIASKSNKKKKQRKVKKVIQPKLQSKQGASSNPNVKVTRHAEPSNTAVRAEKNIERKKKKEEGEMSLAAALASVGIIPQPVDNHNANNNANSGTKSRQPNIGLLQAAQTETVTEVKTLYRFKYQMK